MQRGPVNPGTTNASSGGNLSIVVFAMRSKYFRSSSAIQNSRAQTAFSPASLVAFVLAIACGSGTNPPPTDANLVDATVDANREVGAFDAMRETAASNSTTLRDANVSDATADVTNDRSDAQVSECTGNGAGQCPQGWTCVLGDCVEQTPQCRIGSCSGGTARTCTSGSTQSDPRIVRCADFGATCGPQTDLESGTSFTWCTCGNIPEGDGRCMAGTQYGTVCSSGLGGLLDCGRGFLCEARPQSPFGVGCACSNADDGVCPDTTCSSDPDCAACTPQCGNRACGDNGCGGQCGTCDLGETCSNAGTCETICQPNCDPSWECGTDTCGNSCGTCMGGSTCNGNNHRCEGATCTPQCEANSCGPDGCGGTCGSCGAGLTCSSNTDRCECPFYDTVDYEFDGSAIDYTNLYSITINGKHIDVNGNELRSQGLRFTASETTGRLRWSGCRHNGAFRISYSVRNGRSCQLNVTLTNGRLVLPQPAIANGNCTVSL